MHKVYWTGICSNERLTAISDISARLCRYGSILQFQKFSDLVLSLVVEVETGKLNFLHEDLGPLLNIEGFKSEDAAYTGEVILFLNITFAKGTGDLEFEIPDIPK